MAKAWVTYEATDHGNPDWSLTAGVEVDVEHPDALDMATTRARILFEQAMNGNDILDSPSGGAD